MVDHFKNLFECMKTRQQPIENIEFGCGTAVARHMANLSYKNGGKRVIRNPRQTLEALEA